MLNFWRFHALITLEGEFVLPLNVVGILGLVMEVEVVCIVGVSLAANVQVVLMVVMARLVAIEILVDLVLVLECLFISTWWYGCLILEGEVGECYWLLLCRKNRNISLEV